MKKATKSSINKKKGAAKNCAGINYVRLPKELELHDDEDCHKLFPCKEAMETLIYGIADYVDVGTFFGNRRPHAGG